MEKQPKMDPQTFVRIWYGNMFVTECVYTGEVSLVIWRKTGGQIAWLTSFGLYLRDETTSGSNDDWHFDTNTVVEPLIYARDRTYHQPSTVSGGDSKLKASFSTPCDSTSSYLGTNSQKRETVFCQPWDFPYFEQHSLCVDDNASSYAWLESL